MNLRMLLTMGWCQAPLSVEQNGGGGGEQPPASNGEQGGAPNGNQQPQVISLADAESLILKARGEEKEKLNSRLAREKDERKKAQLERDELKRRMDEMQQQMSQQELSRLKPDERKEAEYRQLHEQMQRDRQEFQRQLDERDTQLRATELVGYRERAIRNYGGEIFESMVQGGSEEAIDEAAEAAHKAWKADHERLRQQVIADLQRNNPGVMAGAGSQPQPNVPVVVVPQNPAFVAPQHVQNPGFPSVVNPQAMVETPEVSNIREITSEDAVRQGKWGGELRKQTLEQLKQMSGSRTLGSTPRHLTSVPAPQQYTSLPGGVQQPTGNPSGPIANPNVQQATIDQARAAVQRTHAGANPLMGQNPGAQEALQNAQATGVNPQVAFSNRFTHTPPIDPNGARH